MTTQARELPAFARLMRETKFAKGASEIVDERMIESDSEQEKSAPAV